MAIDRKALVSRHNPALTSPEPESPLSIGNGELAYTADCTGFQNSISFSPGEVPLTTMTQWGFHSFPDLPPEIAEDQSGRPEEKINLKQYEAGGRRVGYMTDSEGQEELFEYLRKNPHRFNLMRIHLMDEAEDYTNRSFCDISTAGISAIHQELDMWSGILLSRFRYRNEEVASRAACHPDHDLLAFDIRSHLLSDQRLSAGISFPYPSPEISGSDWSSPEKHQSRIITRQSIPAEDRSTDGSGSPSSALSRALSGPKQEIVIHRIIDQTEYLVRVCINRNNEEPPATISQDGHRFVLSTGTNELNFTIQLLPGAPAAAPAAGDWNRDDPDSAQHPGSTEHCFEASRRFWEGFWTRGGAVQLINSRDRRAVELERRIVLSRYLTAVHCSGSLPPQETGLVCNSWYGKFHLEMHPLHTAHFPLWGAGDLLRKSLGYYRRIADRAAARAKQQGYRGLRWPKMTSPEGYDSPSPIGPLLCWQQPHFIYLCELLRRSNPRSTIFDEYKDLVFETAEFMADYVVYSSGTGKYDLAPPLIPAQENHAPENTRNPVFELEYWWWGLKIAEEWKQEAGEPVPREWTTVRENLALPPIDRKTGGYSAQKECTDTYGPFARDHPSFLMALGFLPGTRIDKETMKRSLKETIAAWDFQSAWGWDFPMMAMTAARLGMKKEALELLLMECGKNTYRRNGHNAQVPRDDLPLYLPGNGALLTAVSLLAKGWAGNEKHAAGFPEDGNWTVESENLDSYPF